MKLHCESGTAVLVTTLEPVAKSVGSCDVIYALEGRRGKIGATCGTTQH